MPPSAPLPPHIEQVAERLPPYLQHYQFFVTESVCRLPTCFQTEVGFHSVLLRAVLATQTQQDATFQIHGAWIAAWRWGAVITLDLAE